MQASPKTLNNHLQTPLKS